MHTYHHENKSTSHHPPIYDGNVEPFAAGEESVARIELSVALDQLGEFDDPELVAHPRPDQLEALAKLAMLYRNMLVGAARYVARECASYPTAADLERYGERSDDSTVDLYGLQMIGGELGLWCSLFTKCKVEGATEQQLEAIREAGRHFGKIARSLERAFGVFSMESRGQ